MSFESVNFPGHFLRHQGFRMKLHKHNGSELFRKDATFEFAKANSSEAHGHQLFSFRSINYPNRYLRHRNFELWLDESDGSSLFAADTTLSLENRQGPIRFNSLKFPNHALRHRNFLAFNDPYEHNLLFFFCHTYVVCRNIHWTLFTLKVRH